MGSAERTSEELVTMKYAAVFCLLLIVLLTASTEAKKRGKGGMRKGHRCKDNPIKLCGSDGETYENQCLFWKAKKANKKLLDLEDVTRRPYVQCHVQIYINLYAAQTTSRMILNVTY